MAAVSRRAEPSQTLAERPAGPQLCAADSVAGTAAMQISPPAALQARIAEAFIAPPGASRAQVIGMVMVIGLATWLAGVLMYASL